MTAASPSWRYTAPMRIARLLHNAVVLPDGRVMIVGGVQTFRYTGPVTTPELYDPATETWTPLAPQQASRMYHSTALLLPDGRVFSAGQDYGPLAMYGEVYSPPYLFKGPRPSIAGAPSSVGYGGQLSIATPDSATIRSVVLIRPGSGANQVDTEQRSIPLTFTAGSGALTAQVPTSPSLLPPGYYMLFLVNSAGVPSLAPWVRVA